MSEKLMAPEELAAIQPKYPTREETLKVVQDKYPGHIAWATDRASFSGCRIVTFAEEGAYGLEAVDDELFGTQYDSAEPDSPEAAANLYFSTRANLLVVDKAVSERGITMLITTQLDAEDLEELQEVQRRVNLEMRPWREQRAKERQAQRDELEENSRLLELGKRFEKYNLPKRMRELEEENNMLKAKHPPEVA